MKCWLTTTNYWENLSEKINKRDVMEFKRKYWKLCGKQQEYSYELLPYHSRVVNFHHISDLNTEVVRETHLRHCYESTYENYWWKPAGQTNHSRWVNKISKQVSLDKGKILQRKKGLIRSLFSESPACWAAVAHKVFWKEKGSITACTWVKLSRHVSLRVCLYWVLLFWKHIAPRRSFGLATDWHLFTWSFMHKDRWVYYLYVDYLCYLKCSGLWLIIFQKS